MTYFHLFPFHKRPLCASFAFFFLKVVYFRDTEIWLCPVIKWLRSISFQLFASPKKCQRGRELEGRVVRAASVGNLGWIWNSESYERKSSDRPTTKQRYPNTERGQDHRAPAQPPPTSPWRSGPHVDSSYPASLSIHTKGALRWHHNLTIMM